MTEQDLILNMYRYPYDDNRRLAYADWLEADGQLDRAVFIRTSIEAEKYRLGDPILEVLWKQQREAFERAKPSWWERISNVDQDEDRGVYRFSVGTRGSNRTKATYTRLGKVPWLDQAHKSGWLECLDVWVDTEMLSLIQRWKPSAHAVPLHIRPAPILQLDEESLNRTLAISQLRGLEITYCRSYDQQVVYPRVSQAQHLEFLIVNGYSDTDRNAIDKMFNEILQLKHLRRIRFRDDPSQVTTDKDILRLRDLKSLERLELVHTDGITPQAIKLFRQTRPDVGVYAPYRDDF